MSACFTCGGEHETGLDAIRCDLRTYGEERTRRIQTAIGLEAEQLDALIAAARAAEEAEA